MNRDILERPFDSALFKSRKGPFGQSFSYVEGTEYVPVSIERCLRWQLELRDPRAPGARGRGWWLVVSKDQVIYRNTWSEARAAVEAMLNNAEDVTGGAA